MIHLQTLGRVEVRDGSGRPLVPLLSQPKRVALLVYLAVARPRGLQSRDRILALLWPESDDARARAALNQALTFLRRELGADLIATRGTDAVGLDPTRFTCDVIDVEQAVEGRQWAAALAAYQGDFLEALHVDDAPGLAEWMDRERDRLRSAAVQAAMHLASEERDRGNAPAARMAIQRAREWNPLDERALRLHLQIEAETGNRAAAAMLFDSYRATLARELGVEPSTATRELAQSIRDGSWSANLRRAKGGDGDPPRR